MNKPELWTQFEHENAGVIEAEEGVDDLRDYLLSHDRKAPEGTYRELVKTAFYAALDDLKTFTPYQVAARFPVGDISFLYPEAPDWFGEKGQVSVPPEYFRKMARADYSDWRTALAREFEQNARDAGAREIHFRLDEEEQKLEVEDDGCGMDYDTLVNKLLVLGESRKAEGSVGGFGKAKELLYFAWERYRIHTGDLECTGRGAEYEVFPATKRKGTLSVIWFDEDEDLDELDVLMRSQLGCSQGKAKVFWNDREVSQMDRGTKVRELEWGTVFVKKTENGKSLRDPYAHIRLRGMQMFERYVGGTTCRIVVELKGESMDVLTSNRDNLRRERADELAKVCNDFVVNPESAANADAEPRITKYGPVAWENLSVLKPAAVASVGSGPLLVDEGGDFPIPFILYEKPEKKFWKSMRPESMAKRYSCLAALWCGVMGQVLQDAGIGEDFVVGWTSNPAVEAARVGIGGKAVYLLSLFSASGSGLRYPAVKYEGQSSVVPDLVDLAIHEAAHVREKDHNEPFVLEMARIRKATRTSRHRVVATLLWHQVREVLYG